MLDLECGLLLQADPQFECGLISASPTITPSIDWKSIIIAYIAYIATGVGLIIVVMIIVLNIICVTISCKTI